MRATVIAMSAILLWGEALIGGAATRSTAPRKPAPATAAQSSAPSTTTFQGVVLTVRRESFPNAVLGVDLQQIERATALKGRGDPHRLIVLSRPTRSKNGTVSFQDRRNVALTGAYYLMPGDGIQGRITYGEEGWILDSLERQASPTAPKVASLQVELSTDHDTYTLGEDVQMTLTISNTGSAPAVFNFPTGQRYDFAVRQDGQAIWTWSKDRMFTQTLTSLTVGPEETLKFKETWSGVDDRNRPVAPGTYTVVGWVTATGRASITESTADIEIISGDRGGPTISDLIDSPGSYLNKEITLEGLYRANLAERGEPLTEDGPPTSRSDWILQDTTGSIFVAGSGGRTFNPTDDLNQRVRVRGLIRMTPEGRLYVRAWDVQRMTNKTR